MRALRTGGAVLLAAGALVSTTLAQEPLPTSPEEMAARGWPNVQVWVHETVSSPPTEPLGERKTSPPPAALFMRTGPAQSFQVSVDPNGLNIVGDAANEPSLAIDPTNPNLIAIGWRQFDTINNNFRQAGRAYSTDAGRTWTNPGVINPGVFRSDPVLDADSAGTMYYFSLEGDFTCDMYKSTDGGATWGAPFFAFGGDKQWMAIDRTGSSYDGNIYAAWSIAGGPYTGQPFTRSFDGGMLFDGPFALSPVPVFGTQVVDPNSDLLIGGVDWPTFFNPDFIVAKSSNAKLTGVTPTFSITNVDMGGALVGASGPNPVGLLGQVWIACDHSGGLTHGNLYMLCSVDPGGSDPMDVHFSRSTNGGATWSPPVRINDDPIGTNAYQWFGTMSVAPNGRIDVVWNDTRNDVTPSNPTFSEVRYSYSTDAGLTWTPSVAVTPQFNHGLGYPSQDKLGDYYDMISDEVGASLAYAATFNGEQDVYFMRIGDFDCNGNAVGDSDDIAGGTSTDVNGTGIPDECEPVGDVNCDGAANFGDINAFVLALTEPGQYALDFPDCPLENRDINGDGSFDFGDINAFVALLTAP